MRFLQIVNAAKNFVGGLRVTTQGFGSLEEAGYSLTPFEKGKLAEKPGRKVTGLRADSPRQLMPAGLPKDANNRTKEVQ